MAAAAQFGFSCSKCVSVFGVTIVSGGEGKGRREERRRGNILIGLYELGASEETPCRMYLTARVAVIL